MIDSISPSHFLEVFNFVEAQFEMKNQPMPLNQQDMEALFDVDFCVFLQNAIQAPVRLSLDEKFYVDRYISHGFEQPSRLQRFVERTNIRKFFAPLHYHRNYPISTLLYGSGNLEFIAKKKK